MTPDVSADPAIQRARAAIVTCEQCARPRIKAFIDEATFTVSYVVSDPKTNTCAVIDSVLDFDMAAGRVFTESADRILHYLDSEGLGVDWLLETHAHADHLSAAPYIRAKVGGKIGIGRDIVKVQATFGKIFNLGETAIDEGSAFDWLFDDGESFTIGSIAAIAVNVSGHTPADLAYVVGDAVFVGDTLFMPDLGTARSDFPGGDAHRLFRSIQRLLSLPSDTRLFVCHDYKTSARREFAWETTVAAQRTHNIHVRDGATESEFVAMRRARDLSLGTPKLLLPAIQVNIRGGFLPDPEYNGIRYLKIPLGQI